MRSVAACAAGLVVPPVAVAGSRIAWPTGGCGEPAKQPRAVSPMTIVIAGADPAAPARRVAVGAEVLSSGIVLNGETGLVGLLRPSFFLSVNSEVGRLGASQIGETVVAEDGRIVTPIGVLPNGDTVYLRSEVEGGESDDGASYGERKRCGSSLFVLAAGASQRRTLSLGGCPMGDSFPSPGSGSRIAGDRVYSLVTQRSRGGAPDPVALNSVRGDGGDRHVHARGSYRPPRDLAVTRPAPSPGGSDAAPAARRS